MSMSCMIESTNASMNARGIVYSELCTLLCGFLVSTTQESSKGQLALLVVSRGTSFRHDGNVDTLSLFAFIVGTTYSITLPW